MPTIRPQQQWPRGPRNHFHDVVGGPTERTAKVVALLSGGTAVTDVNQGTPKGRTPLMLAAAKGYSRVVKVLLNKGADVSIVDDDGYTALLVSAKCGHLAVTKLLLKAGADLEATTSNGFTLLHMAVGNGHLEVLRELLKTDADLEATTSNGFTPLHLAAQKGHLGVVAALVKAGADIEVTNSKGFTPLHLAVGNGHLEVVAALLKAGADIKASTSSGITSLQLAAYEGHLDVVPALIEAGADLHASGRQGFMPLHLAAQNGQMEVTKALVKAGADLQAAAAEGCTPLHLAARHGRAAVVRMLLDAGANCDTRLPDGATPLALAATGGHLDVVKALLRAKSNPLLARTDPQSGKTTLPLDSAASSGHAKVVNELIQQVGIEGCSSASGGVYALRVAAREQFVDIMTLLADAGVVDTGEALMDAAKSGHEAGVKLLLVRQERRGVDGAAYVNAPNELGQTSLFFAIGFGRCSPRVVRLLVDAGADATSAARGTETPGGEVVSSDTPLDFANRILRTKKVDGKDATEEQLHGLEGIRRLLLRVDAVHAVSWLWPNDAPIIGRAAEGSRKDKIASTPLGKMLPALRRRASMSGVQLGSLIRCVKSCGPLIEHCCISGA